MLSILCIKSVCISVLFVYIQLLFRYRSYDVLICGIFQEGYFGFSDQRFILSFYFKVNYLKFFFIKFDFVDFKKYWEDLRLKKK